MFDLKQLFDNVSGQVIILLSIVALGLIVTGILTQGFGRTIATVLGIFVLIALILVLANATEVGTWLKNKIFTPNAPAMIYYWRGASPLWNITTQGSLNSLSSFIR